MTFMVVCFPGTPRPREEAINKEMALDASLSHDVAGPWPQRTAQACLLKEGSTARTVIAEVYSKLRQIPEGCKEKG